MFPAKSNVLTSSGCVLPISNGVYGNVDAVVSLVPFDLETPSTKHRPKPPEQVYAT
jgi:hypothetical protein